MVYHYKDENKKYQDIWGIEKKNRLLKTKQFKEVLDYNKVKKSPQFIVFVKPNKLDYLRVGLSVSKKIGKAHERVKIRRQIRAYFSILNMYNISYDVVVIVRNGYNEVSFLERYEILKQSLSSLIREENND